MLCPYCNKEIEPKYEDTSFDFAGTHCTGGVGGTHHSGYWYCPECEEELTSYDPPDEKDYDLNEDILL